MFNKTILAVSVATLFTMSGCASYSTKEMQTSVAKQTSSYTEDLTANNNKIVETTVTNEPYVKGDVVDYVSPNQGNVSINVVAQPLFSVFQGIAEQAKYSAVVASGLSSQKSVSVDLRNVTHEQAMRDIAGAAGYVVVFDHARKTATITDRATYTFRLPTRLFNDSLLSKYSMSNSPAASSSSSSSGGGGGGTASTTTASVTGSTLKFDGKTFKELIQQMAGPDSEVSTLPSEGIVTVRAQSQQLARVNNFLTGYAKAAMTQVMLEVAMVQVNVGDDTASGIDWSKIIKAAGPNLAFSLTTAATAAQPAGAINYTSASIKSVINVLEKTNNAKTLSRQKFPAFNNTSTMMFDGKQVPYIGKVQQSTSGTAGTTTTTGEFSYAMDGISTAVFANIIDNSQVDLTLLPVLATIEGFETAVIGGNTIKAPIQPLSQGSYPFLAKHGQTMIFAGAKFGRESLDKSGLPGIAGTGLNKLFGGNSEVKTERELVFMVNANIVPVQKFNPLVGESL